MTVFVKGTTYRYLAPHWFPSRTVGDDEILRLWKSGKDTYEIATLLQIPEHQIERQLHLARDTERREVEWNWPPEPPAQSGKVKA